MPSLRHESSVAEPPLQAARLRDKHAQLVELA
jgi:hypothetical protein